LCWPLGTQSRTHSEFNVKVPGNGTNDTEPAVENVRIGTELKNVKLLSGGRHQRLLTYRLFNLEVPLLSQGWK
jgi:hypothetical protein